MSSHNIIADVGITLRKLLETTLLGLVTPANILLSSPAEMEVTANRQLCIFLYQIMENLYLRNNPDQRPLDPRHLPPFPVDLHYLFIPYAQEREDEHRIIGRVIQTFHDTAVLKGSILQGTTLAGSDEELRMVYHTVSIDEASKIWTTFPGKPYRLAVGYMVTPVNVYSERLEGGGRVIRKDLDFAQASLADAGGASSE